MEHHDAKVGVAVFVRDFSGNPDDFILMKRQVDHGRGTWGLPGGHLEFGENIEECAIREVKEELGVDLKNVKVLDIFTEDFFIESKKHYITFYVSGVVQSTQTPVNAEYDKCSEISWFNFLNLPTPLFLPVKNYLRKYIKKIEDSCLCGDSITSFRDFSQMVVVPSPSLESKEIDDSEHFY